MCGVCLMCAWCMSGMCLVCVSVYVVRAWCVLCVWYVLVWRAAACRVPVCLRVFKLDLRLGIRHVVPKYTDEPYHLTNI